MKPWGKLQADMAILKGTGGTAVSFLVRRMGLSFYVFSTLYVFTPIMFKYSLYDKKPIN